ncbi:ABC transporter permease [Microbacterium sp. SSW1-47]|uniref:ABC transporter permease n=1 Tax=Microbacterium TaxID=33882 RepID=UPI00109BD2C8|nr:MULTISPECIES: ABC transporter permease [Microbacterium]MBN6191564.1 ABC transporter permease [Aneurinibacillus sp. BA2021]MCK2025604.1 ABC transporter permease [Microbacterium sufflavum]
MIDATPETATTTLSVPRATRARRTTVRTEKPLTLLYLSTLVLGIAVWWIIAVVSDNPLAPTPIAVVQSFWEGLLDGSLLLNTVASVQRVVIGFLLGVIVAVPAGFIMGWYRWGRGLLEPWVQFFRTVPPLALIPLVIVFLGIGEPAKIFVIFLASFLSCVLATFQGVRNVDTTLVNAARVLGASDGTIFLRVVVPASLPFIFVGTRVALGAAWATVVASELIAAAFGLGRMMQAASQFLDTPRIVVGIILIGALGFAMDRALLFAENKLTAWQEVRK